MVKCLILTFLEVFPRLRPLSPSSQHLSDPENSFFFLNSILIVKAVPGSFPGNNPVHIKCIYRYRSFTKMQCFLGSLIFLAMLTPSIIIPQAAWTRRERGARKQNFCCHKGEFYFAYGDIEGWRELWSYSAYGGCSSSLPWEEH